ncbi:MAG: PRC-barrel domain-containing protein [Eubacterium sp.]
MRICHLKQKEVINSVDCKRLGFVSDLEFDMGTGCIHAIIVPGPGKFLGLCGAEIEYIIPFGCIRQVGPDIILVEVDEKSVSHKCKY